MERRDGRLSAGKEWYANPQGVRMKSILLAVLFAVALVGQTSSSQISGTVRDSTGAVIPGAQVTATNEATGIAYRQQTTPAGLYAFASLPAGRYTIAVDLKGFKTSRS